LPSRAVTGKEAGEARVTSVSSAAARWRLQKRPAKKFAPAC